MLTHLITLAGDGPANTVSDISGDGTVLGAVMFVIVIGVVGYFAWKKWGQDKTK